jgi:DNA-binding CsgD family transcriptional regulator
VRSVSAARHPDEFSRRVIVAVAGLIPSDVVTINEVDPEAGRTVYMAEPESFPLQPEDADTAPEHRPRADEILATLADQHPLIRNYVATGDGSAHRFSDFCTQDEFHATELYQRLYRPMGIEYQMAVVLPAPRPIVVGIAVNRSRRDFSERERALLNVLRPHLVQAWYNAKDQAHLRTLLGAATEATAESGAGLIVLSDPPHELTPGALVSLYRFFGRPTTTSFLPVKVGRWMATQVSRLEGDAPLELLKPLRAEIDGRRMVLRYLPGQSVHPGALLLREERRAPEMNSLDALGLTPRESEIVSFVIKGESNATIGETLHVSPTTIKKHLDNIYMKLGVRGRGRLTAFVRDVLERQPVAGHPRRAKLPQR